MDDIWSKVRKDSQYQVKVVQDWVTYLRHQRDEPTLPAGPPLLSYPVKGQAPSIQNLKVEEPMTKKGQRDQS